MSWFVYHTALIPRMFDQPGAAPAQFRRALEEARLPPFRRIEAERTTFALAAGRVIAFPERRPVEVESTIGEPEIPDGDGTGAVSAVGARPR